MEDQVEFISLSLLGNFSSFQWDSICLCPLRHCHVLFKLGIVMTKKVITF